MSTAAQVPAGRADGWCRYPLNLFGVLVKTERPSPTLERAFFLANHPVHLTTITVTSSGSGPGCSVNTIRRRTISAAVGAPSRYSGQDQVVERQLRPRIRQSITVEDQRVSRGEVDATFLEVFGARAHPEEDHGGKDRNGPAGTPEEGIPMAAIDEREASFGPH